MVLTALRGAAALAGVLAYYVAFFMYEDEEGKWQSRIENVWVSVHDKAKESGSKSAALFGKIAIVVTKAFNSFFGSRLLSARFVGTSICSSFAAACLVVFFLFVIAFPKGHFPKQVSPTDVVFLQYTKLFLLLVGVVLLFFAILPSVWHSRWAVAISLLPIIFLGANLVFLLRMHTLQRRQLASYIGLLLSLLSDVLLLAFVRFTVRWVSARATASRAAIAILIQVSIVWFLLLVPLTIAAAFPADFRQSVVLMSLVVMGGLNIFTAVASSLFLLSLLLLLLHRVLWPGLGRILYPLARHQVIRNRALMISIGSACLLFAFPLLNGPTRAFLEWLPK